LLSYLFCSHKYHNIDHYFIFELVKKKMWANLNRIIELFSQKMSLSSQKYGFGILYPEPKSMIWKKTYSASGIPDPQHCIFWIKNVHKCLLNPPPPPTLQRTSRVFNHEISSFFPSLWDNFGHPRSGSGLDAVNR
jgi:hypothetical protein